LARSTGQAMGEFKRGREELEEELSEVEDGSGEDEGSTPTSSSSSTESETETATEPN